MKYAFIELLCIIAVIVISVFIAGVIHSYGYETIAYLTGIILFVILVYITVIVFEFKEGDDWLMSNVLNELLVKKLDDAAILPSKGSK